MSLSDFQILSQVGQGHYSDVYKVKRLHDNHIYALKKVKLVDLSPKQIHQAVNQVRILASIRHPNIISYKQAFYDLQSKSLCIVMEFADGGDLEKKIIDHRNKGLYMKQDYIWDVFGQIMSGLAKLHDLGIIHRDVKSANIYLMRSGTIKIGDLNVSKVIRKEGMCETQMGAPYYSSPQIWRQEAYDVKSDAWSLGCILYELINLKLPFRARDMQGLYKKVNRGYYPRINKSYSEDLAEAVKNLLEINPKQRVSCKQLLLKSYVVKNLKKPRDHDLQQKSVLLRTIKVSKNISYIGQKLPLPNYTPLRYKHSSLSEIENKKRNKKSLSMSLNNSTNGSINSSLTKAKINLPPVPSIRDLRVKNSSNLLHPSNISQSGILENNKKVKREISSEKIHPRYKRAHSNFADNSSNIVNKSHIK